MDSLGAVAIHCRALDALFGVAPLGGASIRRVPDRTVPRCRSRELGEGHEREHDAREDGEGNEDLAYDAAIHGGPVENVGGSCDRSTASSLRPRTGGDPNNNKIV